MHNFDNLQKRCKAYRMKKIFFSLFALIIIVLPIIALFFYSTQSEDSKSTIKPKTSKIQETNQTIDINTIKKHKTPIKIKKTAIKPKKTEHTTQTYALQFLVASKKNIKHIKQKKRYLESIGFKECQLSQSVIYIHLVCNESNNLNDLQKYMQLAKKHQLEYVIRKQYKHKVPQKEIKKPTPSAPEKQKSNTVLKVKNTNIQDLKKQFSQTPSYNIAIVIARNYFKKNSFEDAITWAKKANQLNKSNAESWLVYAKSLYALKKYDKAKQLLQIYQQYENSNEVQNLLKQWEHAQ